MERLQEDIKKLIELMGFGDFSVGYEPDGSRFQVFINDENFLKKFLPDFVMNLEYVVKLMAIKVDEEKTVFIDVNNYRRERENLILELARAAARKAATSKEKVSLPMMNAYERRLIHLELAARPDIKTESVGEGKERYVEVVPID
jgi:spoIIIJ-associated protein